MIAWAIDHYLMVFLIGMIGTFSLLPFYVIASAAKKAGTIPRLVYPWVIALLLVAGVFDVVLLNTTGSLILWDRPFQRPGGHWEISFSQHLKRLMRQSPCYSYRLAWWVAINFVLWIDPKHFDD